MIKLEIDNITEENKKEKYHKAITELSKALDIPVTIEHKEHNKEEFPYKCQEDLYNQIEKERGLLNDELYSMVCVTLGLPLHSTHTKKSIDPNAKKLIRNITWPEGGTVSERDLRNLVEAIDKFLNRNTKGTAKEIVLKEANIARIIDQLRKKKKPEEIRKMSYDQVVGQKKMLQLNDIFNKDYAERLGLYERVIADKITNINEDTRNKIRDTINYGLITNQPKSIISQNLFDKFGDLNKDWQKIIDTETVNVFNESFVQTQVRDRKPGEKVYFKRIEINDNVTCKFCKKATEEDVIALYVDEPRNDDKIDDEVASIAIWSGKSNVGRAQSGWWWAMGSQHPFCRGFWERYIPGMDFNFDLPEIKKSKEYNMSLEEMKKKLIEYLKRKKGVVEKSATHKYLKRIPKKTGKGYTYIYKEEPPVISKKEQGIKKVFDKINKTENKEQLRTVIIENIGQFQDTSGIIDQDVKNIINTIDKEHPLDKETTEIKDGNYKGHKLLLGGQALRQYGSKRYTKDTDYLVYNEESKEPFIHDLENDIDYINAARMPFYKEIWNKEKKNDKISLNSLFEISAYTWVIHLQNFNIDKAEHKEYDMKFILSKMDKKPDMSILKKHLSKSEYDEVEKEIGSYEIKKSKFLKKWMQGGQWRYAYRIPQNLNKYERSDIKPERQITISNYTKETEAVFREVPIPERNPDYVSQSGTQYWIDREGVTRYSDHWGAGIGTINARCNWFIGEQNQYEQSRNYTGSYRCGRAEYKDFKDLAFKRDSNINVGSKRRQYEENKEKVLKVLQGNKIFGITKQEAQKANEAMKKHGPVFVKDNHLYGVETDGKITKLFPVRRKK
jgi:hypothetical protein